jgi:hypothetical protein
LEKQDRSENEMARAKRVPDHLGTCEKIEPSHRLQIYSQGTMCKMIAQCTQQGRSIDDAIAWAESELEGYMRS